MKRNIKSNFMWTKDNIKLVAKQWESRTKTELCEEIGCSSSQLNYMVGHLRKEGLAMPRKSQAGYLRGLISDTVRELKRK